MAVPLQNAADVIVSLILLLPLLMAILALLAGIRIGSDMLWSVPRALMWTSIILGILALALTTYLLDPIGWSSDSDWVAFGEAPPTVDLGLYMVYSGTLAILAASVFRRQGRN